MVFGSALTMAPFVLVIVVALLMGPDFLYFFQKFVNFCVQIYSLGFRRVVLKLYKHAEPLRSFPSFVKPHFYPI